MDPEFINEILSGLPTPIIVADHEGKFIYTNESFCSLLGYEQKDLIGNSLYYYLQEDDISKAKEKLADKERDSPFMLNWKGCNPDYIPLETWLNKGMRANGESYYVLNCRNTSYQNTIFVHIFKHDIKSCTSNILGHADLLKRAASEDRRNTHIEMIQKSACKLLEVLNNLDHFGTFERK